MQNSCQVQLSFEKKTGKQTVFSLPKTNLYQEITKVSVQPKPENLIFDEWGNTVAVFGDTTIVEFLYSPKSLEKSLEKKWVIDNYKVNTQNDFFLKSNRFINGKDAKVKKLSESLVKKEQNVSKIAKTFYNFVLDYLTYGKPTEGLYSYTQALEKKVTDCGGFSTFLLSLLQSVGIPGRLVVGFLIKENLWTKLFSNFELCTLNFELLIMHAWTEILLPDNSWFPMDPSVEWRRENNQSKRKGGFGKIPADRLVTSFGQDFTILIGGKKYNIYILQNPVYV